MPPPDHELTRPIPRLTDTGPLPALACHCRPDPAWRRVAAAALVLAWVTLALWAYALVRIGLLFWEWR